jgi:phage terminase large subunit GpA-like protein
MSTSYGRIFKEVCEFGTDTRIWVPCPKCHEFITCDRKDFSGWQDAKDLVEARARGHFSCSACAAPWTEEDRLAALRRPVIAARDQVVTRAGAVEGPPPATNTWGFRWNAMHNALVSMGDIAEAEFRAERSGRPEEVKALMQFTWAEPYEEQLTDLSGLTRDIIFSKIAGHARGLVPEGIVRLTLAIDPGLYRCWWALMGWRPDASGHVVDYGAIEVHQQRQADPLAILAALRSFRDDTIKPGWSGRQPDLVLVDSGYQKDVVYQFVLESGQPRYLASKGLGSGRDQQGWRASAESSEKRQVGNEWLIVLQPGGIRLAELHSDHWKAVVHEGFGMAAGGPGSLSLFNAQVRDHLSFARQITAERREEEFLPGKGLRVFWNRLWKDNHYLDVTSYARAAADMLGIKLVRPVAMPSPRRAAPLAVEYQNRKRGIRTTY